MQKVRLKSTLLMRKYRVTWRFIRLWRMVSMSSTAALTENGSEKSQILIQRIIWGLTAIFLHRKEMSWKTSHLAEEPVTVEGRECYQMYGDVKGEDLMGLLGRDMISAFGLVDLPSEEAVKELDVPVTIRISIPDERLLCLSEELCFADVCAERLPLARSTICQKTFMSDKEEEDKAKMEKNAS